MTYKMVNQFGNKFTCNFDEIERYIEAKAIFENDQEKAKYEKELAQKKV